MEIKVRMQTDFDTVAGNIRGFAASMVDGVAAASGVEKDRVQVISVTRGSVVVNFRLLDPPPGQTRLRSADEGANRLQSFLSITGTNQWPEDLRPHMQNAQLLEKSSQQRVVVPMTLSATPPMAEVQANYAPPPGCACRTKEAAGIRGGCAEHFGLSPPWCLASGASCFGAKTGVDGQWVFCREVAGGGAARTANSTSASPGVRPYVSAAGAAVRQAALMPRIIAATLLLPLSLGLGVALQAP